MMLEIHDLTKAYGRFQALDHLNLEIEEGELFGFVGPNGAGKTTTIKILVGLLRADGGSVKIDGQPMNCKAAERTISGSTTMCGCQNIWSYMRRPMALPDWWRAGAIWSC